MGSLTVEPGGRGRGGVLRVAAGAGIVMKEEPIAPTVFLVDDDPQVLKAHARLLLRARVQDGRLRIGRGLSRTAPSASARGCLVLD